MLNLIKNALDAVKPFGAAGRVALRVRTEAGYAVLEVEDNGYPLTDEAFEALSSLRPSAKAEGLGVGLAIVRGIVERYAGRLLFSRREGGGLIASVQLPLAAAAPEEPARNQEKS